MAYTNNTPQGNQQIASTQPLIQANFGFLNTGIGTEHNFNSSGSGSDMYHLKVSMPNRALSPALPAGTNGIYFVSSGLGYFHDGTTNFRMSIWQEVLKGTVVSPGSSSNFTIVAGIPNNTFGLVYLYQNINPFVVTSGQFYCNSNVVHSFTNRVIINGSSTDNPVELVNTPGTLNAVRAFCDSSSFQNQTYNYVVMYRPA